jgi:hypothetical protein
VLVVLTALAGACGAPRGDTVVVSGKTVYRGMAVEEVQLEVFPAAPRGAEPVARGRSGYHGSFALRLAPGTYRVAARGSLPGPGGRDLILVASQALEVAPGEGRIDRWVVELRKSAAP